MKNRTLLLVGLVILLSVVLLGCSMGGADVARVTPTPTKTPRPLFTSTHTPTATPPPTDVPLPTDTLVPTDTPPPPTDTPAPTDTPLPPVPTATPWNQSDLLMPTGPPTDTPVPRPTNTPAPPTPTARPTDTPRPQVDFKIKEIYAFEDGSLTSSGLHNVYFTVVDPGGAPIDGIIIEEVNNQPASQVVSGDKGPGKTEFTMWAADYRFKVAGNVGGNTFSSETTHVLSIVFEHAVWDDLIRGGICSDEASCRALGPMHFSYNVTFQRTW